MAPPRRVADPAERTRLQLICSKPQRAILEAAAEAARTDLHTWSMAHLLAAAGRQASDGAPVIVTGRVADRIREAAVRQGITTDRLLEQLLVVVGGQT